MSQLKQRCARVKATALSDQAARHEAIHRRRRLRHWSDPDGGFRLDARLTPEAGAVVVSCLEPYRQRIFDQARKEGRTEPSEADAADALVALAEHAAGWEEPTAAARPRRCCRCASTTRPWCGGWRRRARPARSPRVGPIPVATARALASDSLLSVLVTDGADVKAVAHLGRSIPARLRTALEERDRTCVVPGCELRDRLEIDHLLPLCEGGPTRLDNLARLCSWHHDMKTYQGWRLSGGPGAWRWGPPGGPHGRGPPPHPRSSAGPHSGHSRNQGLVPASSPRR